MDINEQILNQLSRMQEVQAQRHAENIEKMTETATVLSDLKEQLFAPGGRISTLEDKQNREEWKHWAHSAIVLPLSIAVQHYARKIGLS